MWHLLPKWGMPNSSWEFDLYRSHCAPLFYLPWDGSSLLSFSMYLRIQLQEWALLIYLNGLNAGEIMECRWQCSTFYPIEKQRRPNE